MNMLVSSQVFIFLGLVGLASVLGCGPLPQGRVTAMSFTVSEFTLPAEMAYSESVMVQTAITAISHNRDAAMRIVRDIIMNAVIEVLQEQGRNALLPDAVISLILQQLNVTIEYNPLECKTATSNPMNLGNVAMMPDGCFIINDLVTALCTGANCMLMNAVMNVGPIPSKYRTIKGSLETSNVIMANFSKQMWRSVLNRVFQKILSSRLGKYFSTAVVMVND